MLRQRLRQLRKFKLEKQLEQEQEIHLKQQRLDGKHIPSSKASTNLIEKIRAIDKVIKTPILSLKDQIEIPKAFVSDNQIFVDLVKLPKMSSEIVLSAEPSSKKLLEKQLNLLCCPGCLSTILVNCGPPQFPYLLKDVTLKHDYSIDLIKRKTVCCSKCNHEIGFEWAQTLYVKT